MDIKVSTPENIKELVKKAGCKSDWEKRIEAIEELSKYDCQQSKDVIIRLAIHDRVYSVKRRAFLVAQEWSLTKGGKPIKLGKKNIGYKPKDFVKLFTRIRREKKMDVLDLETFKTAFKNSNPEMFDVMKYEKESTFNEWITNIFQSLPKN